MAMLLDHIADRLPGELKQGRETMRNLFNKAGGVAIAVATAAVLSVGSANAQGAEVIFIDKTSDGCGVFDADGMSQVLESAAFPGQGDAVTQAVITPNGNIKLTCNGRLPDGVPAPGRAVFFSSDDEGAPFCGTEFGPSDDWQEVLTRTGRVSLTCHININQQ